MTKSGVTHLDDLPSLKTLPVSPQRGAAIWTEVRGDGVSGIGGFGDGFRSARDEVEAVFFDSDVGAVGRAGDFAAIEAVAECLLGVNWGKVRPEELGGGMGLGGEDGAGGLGRKMWEGW